MASGGLTGDAMTSANRHRNFDAHPETLYGRLLNVGSHVHQKEFPSTTEFATLLWVDTQIEAI
jgi:hypothetical protein